MGNNMKIKNNVKICFASLCLIFIILLSSCSTSFDIFIDKTGSAKIEYSSAMGSSLQSLLESLVQNFSDSKEQTVLFDKKQIEQVLSASGFKDVNCKVSNNSSINCIAFVENLADGLPLANKMIEYSSSKTTGKTVFTLKLSPVYLQTILQSFPEDFQNYAELLMAPVFTSERLTLLEYKDLLASVYGNSVVNELSTSDFVIKIHSPIGTTKTISIPLLEFLTLQNEQIYSFEW